MCSDLGHLQTDYEKKNRGN